jgi:hypothetical protein
MSQSNDCCLQLIERNQPPSRICRYVSFFIHNHNPLHGLAFYVTRASVQPSDACAATLRYFIHNTRIFVMLGKCIKAIYETDESFLKNFRLRFSILKLGYITHKACRNETPKEVVPVHTLKAYVYMAWK